MNMSQILASDTALTIVGGLLGTAWTFFRTQGWYRRSKKRRYFRALRALEAAVERTYRTYVRSIKRGREDGKLTEEEAANARRMARRAALVFGRTEGVDVLREIGQDYLDLWLSRVLRKARRRSVE